MELGDYLHFNKLGKSDFASFINMPYGTFYRILNGKEISLRNAWIIVKATNGEVTYDDLLPSDMKKKILKKSSC